MMLILNRVDLFGRTCGACRLALSIRLRMLLFLPTMPTTSVLLGPIWIRLGTHCTFCTWILIALARFAVIWSVAAVAVGAALGGVVLIVVVRVSSAIDIFIIALFIVFPGGLGLSAFWGFIVELGGCTTV